MESASTTAGRITPVAGEVSATAETESQDSTSEATRYMAAAMYLDSRLCDQILAELENNLCQALGPNYGVDLPIVVEHAKRARSSRSARAMLLSAIFLIPFLSEDFRYNLGIIFEQPDLFGVFLEYHAGLLAATLGLAVVVVFGERSYRERLWAGHRLSRQQFRNHVRVSPDTEHLLPEEMKKRRSANVVVSGGYSPFVGCGISIGGWSFCLRTDLGREEHGNRLTPRDFEIVELYDAITAAVRRLGIPDLRIEDRLYLDGSRIREDRRFLPSPFDRPRQYVDGSIVAEMIGKSSESVRHYRCFEVVDWRGEIVLTLSLRFQCQGGMVFAEANHNLLTPPKKEYLAVDSIAPWPGIRNLVGIFMRSILTAPFHLTFAPLIMASLIYAPIARFSVRRAYRRQIHENPGFNYGAVTSFRERAASNNYRMHFQRLDKEMNFKLLESGILDSFIEFFDDHNIDTSSLRERKTTILNNGVLISGGSVTADAIAAGTGARASLVGLTRQASQAVGDQKAA